MTHMPIEFKELVLVASGKILCRRCQAHSKRTQLQCGAPAERGSKVCRFHGARSTGPRTPEGKWRAARITHGNSTRVDRQELSRELVEIQRLRVLAWLCGLVPAMRSPGRPPGTLTQSDFSTD
jgi:hypothetical protein